MGEIGWLLFDPLRPVPKRSDNAWLQALQDWPGGYESHFGPSALFSQSSSLPGGPGLDCLTRHRRAWRPVSSHYALSWQARVGAPGGLCIDTHTLLGEWDLLYEWVRRYGGEALLIFTDCGSLQLVSLHNPAVGELPQLAWTSLRLQAGSLGRRPQSQRPLVGQRIRLHPELLAQTTLCLSSLAEGLGLVFEPEDADQLWTQLWWRGLQLRSQPPPGDELRQLGSDYHRLLSSFGVPQDSRWASARASKSLAWSDPQSLDAQLTEGIPLDGTWTALLLALELEAANQHTLADRFWRALQHLPPSSTRWLLPVPAPPAQPAPAAPSPLEPRQWRPLPDWLQHVILEGQGGADLDLASPLESQSLAADLQGWPGLRVGSDGPRLWLRGGHLPWQRLATCLADLPQLANIRLQAGAVGYRNADPQSGRMNG